MNISQHLQKATERFDWNSVEKELDAQDASKLQNSIETYLDVILRDGYLIVRQLNSSKLEKRDSFVADLMAFLKRHCKADVFDGVAVRYTGQMLTEKAYHHVLNTLEEAIESKIPVEEFVWEVIQVSDKKVAEMRARVKDHLINAGILVDPVSAQFPLDDSEEIGHPDTFIQFIQSTLSATLKMLSYKNSWFDKDGFTILPNQVVGTGQFPNVAQANAFLATAWSQIERNDLRCRYFGGSIDKASVTFKDDTNTSRSVESTAFTVDMSAAVFLSIAKERIRRKHLGFFVQMSGGSFPIDKNSNELPLGGKYLSEDEAHAAYCMTDTLCMPIFSNNKEFAGLELKEWVRGYAVVQNLGKQCLESYNGQPSFFDEKELVELLASHGLSEEKSRVFLGHVCFNKKTDDVFDSPFIKCQNEKLCFIQSVAASLEINFVVFSQLASLGCNLDFKGKPFEDHTLQFLKSKGLDVCNIVKSRDGVSIEIDMVLLWDEILFVFENKNYSLPNDNPKSQFWFIESQEKAATQVLKKVDAIRDHPDLVQNKLGANSTWKEIVPVVLNGAPFSVEGTVKDVFFYDSSALQRFLKEGAVSHVVTNLRDGSSPIDESTVRLWDGDSPTAADFIRQLESPVQVKTLADAFQVGKHTIPVADGEYITYQVLNRKELTLDEAAQQCNLPAGELESRIRG